MSEDRDRLLDHVISAKLEARDASHDVEVQTERVDELSGTVAAHGVVLGEVETHLPAMRLATKIRARWKTVTAVLGVLLSIAAALAALRLHLDKLSSSCALEDDVAAFVADGRERGGAA